MKAFGFGECLQHPLAFGFLAVMCMLCVALILVEDKSHIGVGLFLAAFLLGYATAHAFVYTVPSQVDI